jgi:hypothetical protein
MLNQEVQARVVPNFQKVFKRGRVTEGGVLRDERDAPRDHDRDNQNRDGHDKGEGGEVEYKVELLCRTFVGDSDVRPLASNQVFWESPDLWVVGPGGPDLPQAGVVNQVFVHVWNLGLQDSTATFVELYWCNPSVGVNAAQSNVIGVQTISLGAQDDQVVSFDWTPTFENGGHECLVAQVYNPLHDPLVAPFNPVLDRHVAQRNVTVLLTQAGKTLDFQFFAANFGQRTAMSQLSLEPVLHADLSTLAQATGQPFFLSAPGATALLAEPTLRPITPSLDITHTAMQVFRETLEPTPHPVLNQVMQHQLLHGERLEMKRFDAGDRETKVELKQWHHNTLHLPPLQEAALAVQVTTAKDSPRGSVQAYRVIERVGERITGGVTVLVQVE